MMETQETTPMVTFHVVDIKDDNKFKALGFISSEMDPSFPPKIRYRPVLFLRRVVK